MSEAPEILRRLGFPENPIEILTRIASGPSRPQKRERQRLVALQMVMQDPQFTVHPRAWGAFLTAGHIPAALAPSSPPPPVGWPVPVSVESAGCGGVVHVRFQRGELEQRGHRLDLSGAMEAFLQCCSEAGEEAFPDPQRFPFVARARPGLPLDGRSWELPCLIGYFSTHSAMATEPVFATGSIEQDGSLGPAWALEQKVEGWIREVGPGTKAVLLPAQKVQLGDLVEGFAEVLIINELYDLIAFLRDQGWLAPHQFEPNEVRCERLLRKSQDWYQRNRPKMALLTLRALERHRNLLSPRQELLWLGEMHFLLSCFGRFGDGLGYLHQMRERLHRHPEVLTRDEEAIHLAKAAVQLYDAHRFGEAEELLRFVLSQGRTQDQMSPVCRAKVLGTLGQVLTARGDFQEARSVLNEAGRIFEAVDPLEVSRAYHYLIHNRLRAADLDGAERLLETSRKWLEETDTYGTLFREFYQIDLCRRRGRPCQCPSLMEGYKGLVHPYCFALQAWARNREHPTDERIRAIQEAVRRLEESTFGKGGVLEFLGLSYRLYEASLVGDASLIREAWEGWARWVQEVGGQGFRGHYSAFLSGGVPDHSKVDALMERIPYH